MTKEQIKEIKEWSKNIAENYRKERELNPYSALLDACKELGLDKDEMEERCEWAGDDDFKRKEGIYFILTGKAYPSKKGYTWA